MTNVINDDEVELYALLGLMVRNAADLEFRLQMLAEYLSQSPYAHLWIHGVSANDALRLIREIAKEHPRVIPPEREAFEDLAKRASQLLNRRHGYVHGAWSMDGAPPESTTYQAIRFTKGKREIRFDPLSKEDLRDLIQKLSTLTSEIMNWQMGLIKKINSEDERLREAKAKDQ
ncbi:hypothetical protein OG418_33665 [Streptomyces phaeochromogenes]|uniref:hypothetical protein n=1 Tax=Streptomyces phaeochromogenes TaxID=1923 RepID=UPI0032461364